jgi:hypothetical protein
VKIDYSKPGTPAEYKCSKCGAIGCKLWRGYQDMRPDLLCCECAAKEEKKDISDIDEKGMRNSGIGGGYRTDQIGWQVPAVPDEEGFGYWGYCSVPQAGCDWWRNLPTRPVRKPKK